MLYCRLSPYFLSDLIGNMDSEIIKIAERARTRAIFDCICLSDFLFANIVIPPPQKCVRNVEHVLSARDTLTSEQILRCLASCAPILLLIMYLV
jgi:hypothetical protein